MARCGFAAPLILVLVSVVFAENTPQSDPRAVSLATQAMSALMNGVAVSDVTLSGNAVWNSGANAESGTATAHAKTNVSSRLDLILPSGKRSELRNSVGGFPRGAWINGSGKLTLSSVHNCWTDAVWFFPGLTSLSAANSGRFRSSQAKLVLVYVGLETRNNRSVQHIQSYQYLASTVPQKTAFTQKMSTVDYYLDAQTLVPLSVTFSAHPDNDASTDIAVEVDYSDYQQTHGILVPFHITKLWQGNPLLDVTVTNVAINSGLPNSLFSTR
jgi:hypothetical protein